MTACDPKRTSAWGRLESTHRRHCLSDNRKDTLPHGPRGELLRATHVASVPLSADLIVGVLVWTRQQPGQWSKHRRDPVTVGCCRANGLSKNSSPPVLEGRDAASAFGCLADRHGRVAARRNCLV